jgi:hypothetical protein
MTIHGAAGPTTAIVFIIVMATMFGTLTSATSSASPQTCLNNSYGFPFPREFKVAVVKPIFTSTPYSEYSYGSFYAFYRLHPKVSGMITGDLGFLKTNVSNGLGYHDGWGLSLPLYSFLSSQGVQQCGLVFGRNMFVLSDLNVSRGDLSYANGSVRYNVVITGFTEYVTQKEYSQYREYVSNGGRLLMTGGDNFQAKVNYSSSSGLETFVEGHGYSFNGTYVKQGPKIEWQADEANWVASTNCCFYKFNYSGAVVNEGNPIGAGLAKAFGNTVFDSYHAHEEAAIRNFSHTSVIATFGNWSGTYVGAYTHQYKHGTVVCLCISSDDVILTDMSLQYSVVLSVAYPLTESPTTPAAPKQTIPLDLMALAIAGAAAALGGVYLHGRVRTRHKRARKRLSRALLQP